MEWTIERAHRGFLTVRTDGRFSVDDHRRMVEDILARGDWRPGTPVLFDNRRLDFGEVGIEAMHGAHENHRAHDAEVGGGRVAILMGSVADFGTGRQFELLSEGHVQAQLRVFQQEEDAIRWLTDADRR